MYIVLYNVLLKKEGGWIDSYAGICVCTCVFACAHVWEMMDYSVREIKVNTAANVGTD